MLSCLNSASTLRAKYRFSPSAFIKGSVLALLTVCNVAFASPVTYNLTTQGPLYATNLELLGAVTDISEAQYWAEYDVYFTGGGTASASFTYDNQAGGFLTLSNTEARVGDFVATSAAGFIFVADGTFNNSIPYDPLAPSTDGVSLHLGNATVIGLEDFSGFSIGDWTLNAVIASWFEGEFISDETLPVTLPPPPGYEISVLTFVFNNSAGDTAIITSPGMEVAPVPVPAAAWLLGSALIGLAGIRRKKQS